MKIIIENLAFFFRFKKILFLDSQFYDIDKNKLIKFLRYSGMLGINIPDNLHSLEYIINNCFETIDSNHENSEYYYGVLTHLLLNYWNNYKIYFLLNKYQDYINYVDYKKILNSEKKDCIIIFYYIIRNLQKIDYKDKVYYTHVKYTDI